MTDRFDEAAQRLFKWGDLTEEYVATLLRDNWNTATDAAAEAVRTNTLLSGSIGPLMDMGWNAANKAGADAVLKLKVGS